MTKLKQPKEIVKQELIEAVTNIENVKQLKRLAFMLIECILKQDDKEKEMAKTKNWEEEKVDKLIKRMRSGDNVVYFDDDDVFGESMFDARTILRKKLKNIDNIFCVYNPIAKDDYLYIWKGDRVFLLTTKSKMKTLIY